MLKITKKCPNLHLPSTANNTVYAFNTWALFMKVTMENKQASGLLLGLDSQSLLESRLIYITGLWILMRQWPWSHTVFTLGLKALWYVALTFNADDLGPHAYIYINELISNVISWQWRLILCCHISSFNSRNVIKDKIGLEQSPDK